MKKSLVLEKGQMEAVRLACSCFVAGYTLTDFQSFTVDKQLNMARNAGLINPAELLAALRYFETTPYPPVRVDPVITELLELQRRNDPFPSPPETAHAPAG
jgi:hypothetical protein